MGWPVWLEVGVGAVRTPAYPPHVCLRFAGENVSGPSCELIQTRAGWLLLFRQPDARGLRVGRSLGDAVRSAMPLSAVGELLRRPPQVHGRIYPHVQDEHGMAPDAETIALYGPPAQVGAVHGLSQAPTDKSSPRPTTTPFHPVRFVVARRLGAETATECAAAGDLRPLTLRADARDLGDKSVRELTSTCVREHLEFHLLLFSVYLSPPDQY